MSTITPALLKAIRPEIEAALAEVAEKHGIKFHCANAKYSAHDFTFQLKGEVLATDDGKSPAEAEWSKSAYLFGLDHVPFGATFKNGTKVFTITALDFKKRKYPILADDQNGRGFKFPVDVILRHFPEPAQS